MKVLYTLNSPEVCAISTLAHIDGNILNESVNDLLIVEYDITSDQKSMLDTLLSTEGYIVKDKLQWPSDGDLYYYINNFGSVLDSHWCMMNGIPDRIDVYRRDIGNIFKTEEEAVFEIERLKVLNQLKNLSNDDQEWNNKNLHYHIVYEPYYDRLNVYESSCGKSPYICYFKTKESAEAVIEAIGKDKFKKYVFNVKET